MPDSIPISIRIEGLRRRDEIDSHLGTGIRGVRTIIVSSATGCDPVIVETFDESAERMTNGDVVEASCAGIGRVSERGFDEDGHLTPGDRCIGTVIAVPAACGDVVSCQSLDVAAIDRTH